VLTNLAGNAVKFTATGHVLIEVWCEEQAGDLCRLKFMVQDTGIGIPEDKLEHVFERFTQADTSTTRRFGGTGLGLAISKQLVGLMGGQIGICSQLGAGSTFWFTLPVRLPSERAVAPEQAVLNGVRVLILEDNELHRRVLQEQVSAWQMRPALCASSGEALPSLRQACMVGDPFQVVLVDVQMPGIHAATLLQSIKADAQLGTVAVILLTPLANPEQADRLKQTGAFGCLIKPVRQSKLWSMLVATQALRFQQSPTQFLTRAGLPHSEPSPKPSSMIHARVLVVDDSATNQKVGRLILEKLGCCVDVSVNGKDALEKLADRPYDLVFMDCEMPEMDGFAATAEIRRRQTGQWRIPIIAMTAKAILGDRERCLAAGMDDYISKPVRVEQVRDALARWTSNPPSTPVNVAPSPANCSAPAENPTAALDPAVTERLRNLASDTDSSLLDEIYSAFLTTSVDYLSALRQATRSDDASALRNAAHAFKGASANIGARVVTDLCAQLEALGRAESVTGADELVARLECAFDKAKLEIESQMSANEAS
jgi:CheY-like chemotaxis protein/HPt (histidine-containing phosphotransfer) domain-containing protein